MMKTIAKVAGVVSTLALGYTAFAGGDEFNVKIDGKVAAYCTIQDSGFGSGFYAYSSAGAPSGTPHSRSLTFDFGSAFADAQAKGVSQWGAVQFYVKANAPCTYTLISKNGALQDIELPHVFRPYRADAHEGLTPGTTIGLDSLSPNRTVSSFSIATPVPGTSTVTLEFDIPPSGPLAAGTYQDVLTLTITPST